MPHSCGRTHSHRLRPLSVAITEETRETRAGATHDQIAARAYYYWEQRGRQGGSPWEDWFRAEKELNELRKET